MKQNRFFVISIAFEISIVMDLLLLLRYCYLSHYSYQTIYQTFYQTFYQTIYQTFGILLNWNS